MTKNRSKLKNTKTCEQIAVSLSDTIHKAILKAVVNVDVKVHGNMHS